MDSFQRSCPCKPGWYTSSLSPFTCSQLLNTDENGNNVAQEMEACQLEIGQKTKDLIVGTDCHFDNSSGNSFVVSAVTLRLSSISLSQSCYGEIRTSVEYFNPNDDWRAVPNNRVTAGPNGD